MYKIRLQMSYMASKKSKLFHNVQVKEKNGCILWYAKKKSPTKILWKFHEKYGRNSNALNNKTI